LEPRPLDTYPLAITVVEGLEFDDIRMADYAHDLKLSILRLLARRSKAGRDASSTHLEPLVLQHPLDRSVLPAGRQLRVENYAERTVSDNLALRVGEIPGFAGEAVLDLFANDFYGVVSSRFTLARGTESCSPPILKLEKAVGRFCDIAWLGEQYGDPTPTGCYREHGGLAVGHVVGRSAGRWGRGFAECSGSVQCRWWMSVRVRAGSRARCGVVLGGSRVKVGVVLGFAAENATRG
jgi:hypothetical protein